MQKQIKIGLVGCGRISAFHLPAIKKQQNVELAAVADLNENLAKEAARNFGVPKYYTNATELFRNKEIEAVVLCLPHYLHAPLVIEAAGHGKHILVEKPLALTLQDADKMIKAADDAKVILMVGHVQRFFRQYQRTKDLIKSGKLGKPLQVIEKRLLKVKAPPTPWWKSSEKTGGLLLALNGTHSIDFYLSLFETSAIRVYCETLRNNLEWEGEDEFSFQMKLANEAIISMHHSFNAQEDLTEITIVGSEGTLRFNGIAGDFRLNGKIEMDFAPAFEAQCAEFIAAVRERREPITSARHVREVIRVFEAARLSAAKHEVIGL